MLQENCKILYDTCTAWIYEYTTCYDGKLNTYLRTEANAIVWYTVYSNANLSG